MDTEIISKIEVGKVVVLSEPTDEEINTAAAKDNTDVLSQSIGTFNLEPPKDSKSHDGTD